MHWWDMYISVSLWAPKGPLTNRYWQEARCARRAAKRVRQRCTRSSRKPPELPQWQRSVLTTGPPRPKPSFPFGAGAVDALPGRSARATRALPGAIAQRPRRGACLPRRGRQLTGGGLLDAGSAGAVVCEGQALGGNT